METDKVEDGSEKSIIYSNNPSPVYFLKGEKVHYTPKTFGIPMYSYEAFLSESQNYENQYIIWFGNEESSTVYTPQQFTKDFTVTEMYRDGGFSIYELERDYE